MANKHTERCSISLVIRDMQITTTMRHDFTPIRIAKIKKTVSGAPLIAQVVKNHLQCRRPQFDSWVRKIPWRRDRLSTPVFLGFPGGFTAAGAFL